MYKISTWNIERPRLHTEKTRLAIKKILEENSDIIVLTETSNAVELSSVYPYSISTESHEHSHAHASVKLFQRQCKFK